MDQALIGRWLAHPGYADDLCAPGRAQDAETIRRRSAELAAPMQHLAEPVFERFLDLVGRPARRHTLPSREWG